MAANSLGNRLIAYLKILERSSSDNSLALNDLNSLRYTIKLHPDKRFHILAILDNTKPNGSVLIQSGNANSNNRLVGLQLQGTDTNGITGFLVSETNQQNPNGFTSVSSASNFSKNLNHDLTSSGDGTKTIYVWYRDHAGNIEIGRASCRERV